MAQIGTIKLQTQNSGTVDVPVFNTGDSGSNVFEFLRVQTASGTGFIPLVDTAEATFPYLRVQSQNNGVVAVHNVATLGLTEQTIYLEDDWNDNTLSSRTNASDSLYAHPQRNETGDILISRYRPDWDTHFTEGSMTISATNNAVEFDGVSGGGDDGIIVSGSRQSVGRWEIDADTTNATNGTMSFSFMVDDNLDVNFDRFANCYFLYTTNDGSSYNLYVVDNGSQSTIIEVTGSQTITMGIERDSFGNFEMFENGTSVATTTNTAHTDSEWIGLGSRCDSTTYFDNLLVN